MKEPARAINKYLCFNREFHLYGLIAYGSVKTIPNPLRQLPVINLMISEALPNSICSKGINYYQEKKHYGEKI